MLIGFDTFEPTRCLLRFAAFCWTLLYDDHKQEDVNFACGIQYLSTLDIVASVACNFSSNSSS
jgi:hypothetical protein